MIALHIGLAAKIFKSVGEIVPRSVVNAPQLGCIKAVRSGRRTSISRLQRTYSQNLSIPILL
jgi:hypothetical protein